MVYFNLISGVWDCYIAGIVLQTNCVAVNVCVTDGSLDAEHDFNNAIDTSIHTYIFCVVFVYHAVMQSPKQTFAAIIVCT